ncbi:MAG: 16S rRNA (cytosine(1402)-N(4))-methyltransferase RsmH [Oscillospiraceae bacterium]|nr:16S rRNA (cytosine(1402)-N(4))-methyltransferase RsmH [Oscillospiraceae bacterium]
MQYFHKSVLLEEAVNGLDVKEDGIYVDATGGAGGHAREIQRRLGDRGKLVIIDRDPDAVEVLTDGFKEFERVSVVRANFCDIREVLDSLGIEKIDGVLMDLGVSSFQLDNAGRGFCYNADAALDMRMEKDGVSAKDVVNGYPLPVLVKIFRDYGEERFAFRIAENIGRRRRKSPIETTQELVRIIEDSIPAAARKRGGNPSKRVFQAIRIEVNNELDSLKLGLDAGFERLDSGGRLCVIAFHSLEDSLVKESFRRFVGGCICPADFPVCSCGKKIAAEIITKGAVTPCEEEIRDNKRSRSAMLRVIKKI